MTGYLPWRLVQGAIRGKNTATKVVTPMLSFDRTMGEYVVVNIPQGSLRGRKRATKSGGPLNSFQGIPYAKTPVGSLRFKAPKTPEPWSGTRDALHEGSNCSQLHVVTNKFIGDEDCLFINVYTSKIPSDRSEANKPVMVWIHGGGFMQGSGDSNKFGPDYLVDAGVVLVTFNYRVGPLGFLDLGCKEAPGNAGLKDQVAALKWVQQNITTFGGDPNNVTIFGESSGGSSVHFHMLSPMSKGLFKKAICQSGLSTHGWAVSPKPHSKAFSLGKAMGCETEDKTTLLNFFMQTDTRQLVESIGKVMRELEKVKPGPTSLFLPTVESAVDEEGTFLSTNPHQLLAEGKFEQVPCIVGVNSHEGLMMIGNILEHPEVTALMMDHLEIIVPRDLKQKNDEKNIKEIANRIKEFYFKDHGLPHETALDVANLSTDLFFLKSIHNTMKIQSSLSSEPTFYYKFSFSGALNGYKQLCRASQFPGACHGDEMCYLFRSKYVDTDLDPTSPEMKTISRMVKMWTNFAKTGNPTPDGDSDLPVKWKPYTTSDPAYLHIDNELTLERHLEKERMEFWEEIYKKYQ